MDGISNISAAAALGLVSVTLLFTCGCSSFNYEWRKAAKKPIPANSVEGPWQGQWLSDVNGHNGKLQCLMSRQDDGNYSAHFRATYKKFLHFSYTVPLKVEHAGDTWRFTGDEDLGKLAGGVYHYEGSATPAEFHSTYRSRYDHGVFSMKRP